MKGNVYYTHGIVEERKEKRVCLETGTDAGWDDAEPIHRGHDLSIRNCVCVPARNSSSSIYIVIQKERKEVAQ